MRRNLTATGVVVIFLVGAAPIAAWGQGSLESCAEISDDGRRLACYDRLAGRVMQRIGVPTAPSSGPTTAPVRATELAVATVAESPAAGAPVAVDPVADFGLSERVKNERESEKWVESITARVTNIRQTASGRYVITLDNGQVWVQSETSTRTILAPGDTVTIKRAALGSFKLSGPRSVYWRMRRLQ